MKTAVLSIALLLSLAGCGHYQSDEQRAYQTTHDSLMGIVTYIGSQNALINRRIDSSAQAMIKSKAVLSAGGVGQNGAITFVKTTKTYQN